jgi:hypothetical protein
MLWRPSIAMAAATSSATFHGGVGIRQRGRHELEGMVATMANATGIPPASSGVAAELKSLRCRTFQRTGDTVLHRSGGERLLGEEAADAEYGGARQMAARLIRRVSGGWGRVCEPPSGAPR